MAQKNQEYRKLPLLALRGLHVFPGMLLTFDVERPASIAALNTAIRADQIIFLSAQKDLSADLPTEEEIYAVGTVCRIRQQLRQPHSLQTGSSLTRWAIYPCESHRRWPIAPSACESRQRPPPARPPRAAPSSRCSSDARASCHRPSS